MTTNVAVIHYSSTGNVHALAQAEVDGAQKAGAETRLLKVAELAPAEAIEANEEWKAHAEATQDLAEASPDDMLWADAVIFGSPTRYGAMTSQLKQFIDQLGPLWAEGKLVDKVYSAFTSSQTNHGGQESTILSINNAFYHWGGVIVGPGYADPIQFEHGNPYGASHVSGAGGPGRVETEAARFQGQRVAQIATALKRGLRAPD
ncbi:MAG TPA: NAD(P)H:quinone oxidoreductase [Nocardioidaceae bacterium]|nr:NAD(P)H:quinone oxidoreductase [Nocardioidaceae bacterium]